MGYVTAFCSCQEETIVRSLLFYQIVVAYGIGKAIKNIITEQGNKRRFD